MGVSKEAGTPNKAQSRNRKPLIGTAEIYTVIDDHSRNAYAEIHARRNSIPAVGVLRRAVSWFAARCVVVERLLSDNGSAFKSHLGRDTCRELNIKAKKTRPTGHRPTARSNASTATSPTGGPLTLLRH
ncbi:DDE-type integrase/transposase/recombinase [Pseudarthrobacter enclensis]|uniref:DDE-type integrase/transposase/recombinase n=1 Tax=Pseudarthrobacter enclensis TaxID=993070 RepID=UPI00368A13F3